MNDQAAKLRQILHHRNRPMAKTIAVVSGKGGVGKSNISINTAIMLARRGYKVLLFDFDIGMGNVNILLGETGQLTLADFLQNDIPFENIIYTMHEQHVSYISAGNGLNELLEIDEVKTNKLLLVLRDLQLDYDYIIFDMAAGAGNASLNLLLATEDIFVVATPEPTSVMDAYSMMKFICLKKASGRMMLICNRADNEKQGYETLERLKAAALKFLHKDVHILGVLPEDSHVRKSVINQTAFSIGFPNSPITKKLETLVHLYLSGEKDNREEKKELFVGKLRRLLFNHRGAEARHE